MTSVIRNTAIDCADPYSLANFWREVTGFAKQWDYEPDEDEAGLLGPDGQYGGLFFNRVPEAKVGKNRVHICVTPVDRSRDEEVARLLALGATQLHDRREDDGTGWVVLADPEGNEFCVLRSPAERGEG